MPLDIVLSKNGKVPIYNTETSISFHASADYWYLWPTMIQEIKNQTGELLDLYDDAEFSGEDLVKLETIIAKYLEQLGNKKEQVWDVSVGTQIKPVVKEIFKPLIKEILEAKLEKFLFIIRLAKETNGSVI